MKHIVILAPSRSGHNWTAKVVQSWFTNGDKVHQFEAVEPKLWRDRVRHRIWKGLPANKDQQVITFIQLRDYLNFAASWTKYMVERGNAYRERGVTKLYVNWLEIAKEGFRDTNYVGDKYNLLYDQFVQDEGYRRALCGIVEGEYTEEMINYVPGGGMGSSFDKKNYQDNGSEMKVLERWQWFNTEEGDYYKRYLKAVPEALEYYREHFDLNEGQTNLVNEILNS